MFFESCLQASLGSRRAYIGEGGGWNFSTSQSLHRKKARDFSKSQSLNKRKAQNFSESQNLYRGGDLELFSNPEYIL